MASVHQCKFAAVFKGAITPEVFLDNLRTLVDTKAKAEDVTERLFDEIENHVKYNDYHRIVNGIFQPMIKTEDSKESEDDSAAVNTVYRQLWRKVSKMCQETPFTVFLGAGEEARLHPLLKDLEACVL